MALIAKTTNYSAPFPASFRAYDGTCAKEWAVVRSGGSVTVRKLERESRVKPDDLLRNMTERATQSIVRTQNLVYKRVTATNTLCGGVYKGGLTTTHETTAVRSAILNYPTADWAQALRLKLLNMQHSFAETIGEWRESVKYLEGGANVLKRAARDAKRIFKSRRKRKTMMRMLKQRIPYNVHTRYKTPKEWQDVASVHLAITYGITPIISEIEGVLEQLNSIGSRAMRVQVTVPTEAHTVVQDALGPYEATGVRTYRAIAYVWFKDDMADFTAGNLAESIWAGTSLSFMVDWFINVGGFLQALNSLDFIREVRGSLTVKETKEYRDYGEHVNGLITPGKVNSSSIYRQLFSDVPMPSKINVSLPSGSGVVNKLVSAMEILLTMRNNTRNNR